MSYATGGWRWLNGTPSIPSLFVAAEGPKIVRRGGIDRIRAKSVRQTQRLIELADERGYNVNAPRKADERGGTVAFDVPHAYEIAQLLLSKGVVVDYRPGAGVRIAPHFYTTDSELEHAVALIDEGLASAEWKRFEAKRGVVT
jgi:kynureninase